MASMVANSGCQSYRILLPKPWILIASGVVIYCALLYIFIISVVLLQPNFVSHGFLSSKFFFAITALGFASFLCLYARTQYPKLSVFLLIFYALNAVSLPYISTYIKDTYSPSEALQKKQAQELLISDIETTEPMVALTFDDGPTPGKTEAILDVLKKENVHATFFIIGQNLKDNEDIIRRAYNEGNEIGNHTYSHLITKFVPTAKADWEYMHTSELIKEITGEAPKYCRPPTGLSNLYYLKRMNEKYGMKPIYWTNTSSDWSNSDDDACYKKAMERLPLHGAIFLHHDHSSSPRLIERIIHDLRERGYRFVTISEMLEHQVK